MPHASVTAAGPAGSRLARLRPTGPTAALWTILIAQLMVVLDVSIVNIALPDMQRELDFTSTSLSWVVNAYGLTFGGLLLLGARAGDLFGRRRVFLAGLALFTVASAAGGLAQDGALLLAARAIQGIGAAFAAPSALALLTVTFPGPAERTRALGLYTAASIGGAGLGLIAGGVLVEWLSWRWVFFVNVPIGLVLLVLATSALPETVRARGHVDIPGAITSTLGMSAVVYGFVHAASDGWSDPLTIVSFVVGVVMIGAFVAQERRVAVPITPLRLFADRTRVSAYVARMLLVAAMMGIFFFLTQFLQDVLGYSPLMAGLAFLPLTAMVFIASQLSARVWTPRFGTRWPMVIGVSFSTLGVLGLTQLHPDSGYISLLVPLILFGFGNGTAFVPLTGAALAGVKPEDAGAASGLVNVTQQVGGALGLAVLVTVFGAAANGGSPSQAFASGADTAFWVAAGLLALCVLIAVTMRTPKQAPAPAPVTKDPQTPAEAVQELESAGL
ncbi:MFS transporter [Jatrophihabitans sp. YIM 134969]